jgi:2-polyprenyl-3-methyl-5-hydroxy-6-metoxy-1,4-benzoquinol methylase
MPDWQERITRDTQPALRVEHALRYDLAAPLVKASATWCDLGCGNGVAAADALGGAFAGRAVLVDVDETAAQTAASEVGGDDAQTLVADLNAPSEVERVREAILAGDAPRVVTCFEVIEHLRTFVPLVEMLAELSRSEDTTVLFSVPNDAFWALENPYHETMWGEGAFDELRRLLPEGTRVVKQVALQGSAVVPVDAEDQPARTTVEVEVHAADAVPTHLLAVLGPRAGEVGVHAGAGQTDLDAQRAWERQREADLAYLQALTDKWRAELREHHTWFEEWRAYINDLEGRLGITPSGASREELPSGENVADRVAASDEAADRVAASDRPSDDAT